jgi:hypothetical protein
MKLAIAISAGMLLLAGAVVHAKDEKKTDAAPKIFADAINCRQIADDVERLKCYDETVGKLATAQANREVYVADKEEVKKSRKGLFGFTLSDIGIFGGDGETDKIDAIEATIKSVREAAGKYTFVLDDGAVWAQTEAGYVGLTPKPGQKIAIKRAAMGSYMGRVENGRTIRMKRINN